MIGKRHPLNAEGDFYVKNKLCICCDAPRCEAPELIAYDENMHCYFIRQLQTKEETEQAINAVLSSCVEALHYAGNDPYVLERLKEQPQSCDFLVRK